MVGAEETSQSHQPGAQDQGQARQQEMETLLLARHKNLTRDNGPLPKLGARSKQDPALLTHLRVVSVRPSVRPAPSPPR